VHYRRDGKMPEDTNKKNVSEDILWDSVRERVRHIRKHPAKVLLVPPLCVGYVLFFAALYINVIVYHDGACTKRKGRF
jgi:hypothetical protein